MRNAMSTLPIVAAIGLLLWLLFGGPDGGSSERPQAKDRGARATSDEPPIGEGPVLAGSEASPSKPPPEAISEFQAVDPDAQVFTGRVLDDRRMPVAGAEVEALAHPRFDHGQAKAITDAEGRYRLYGVPSSDEVWAYVTLRATHGGRAGFGAGVLRADAKGDQQVKDIFLAPLHALDVIVRNERGGTIADAPVSVVYIDRYATAVIAHGRADAAGSIRFEGLAEGRYLLIATPKDHGRGTTSISVPATSDVPLEVRVGSPRSLVVQVIDRDTEAPIVGARVVLDELMPGPGRGLMPYLPAGTLLTDAQGEVRFEGLGETDAVQPVVHAEGYPGRGAERALTSVPLDQERKVVKLTKLKTIRVPIKEGDPHAPSVGTQLKLRAASGLSDGLLPSAAVIEDGYVRFDDVPSRGLALLLLAPDGNWANAYVTTRQPDARPVAFEEPRRVEVAIRRSDGRPAEGLYASLRVNAYAPAGQQVRLDASGRATLRPHIAHVVDCYVAWNQEGRGGIRLGSVNLKDQREAHFEAMLPHVPIIELTMTIDGTPRLPKRFSIRDAEILSEDPTTGLVRFVPPFKNGKPRPCRLGVPGFLPVVLDMPSEVEGAVHPMEVALSRGGSAVVELRLPKDGLSSLEIKEEERYRTFPMGGVLGAQRQDVGTNGDVQSFRFAPLKPGRYLIVDRLSHARTKPFEVRDGEESRVQMDLSRSGVVRGRVHVPEGYSARRTLIRVRRPGEVVNPRLNRGSMIVKTDGSFEVRVPGGQPVHVSATHAKLILGEGASEVVVQKPGEEVAFRFVEGAELSFKLGDGTPDVGPRRTRRIRVYLERSGEQVLQRTAEFKDGIYSVPGLTPGTYHVMLDSPGTVLHVIENLRIAGKTNLNEIQLSVGGRLRVRLDGEEGKDLPAVTVQARALKPVQHYRRGYGRGQGDVVVRGLQKGSYEISVSLRSGEVFHTRTVESDGTGEVVIDVDVP